MKPYFSSNSIETNLVARLKNGEMEAFSLIYTDLWDDLHGMAFKILKDDDLVQDVIHDVFADLWEQRSKIFIAYSLKAYLIVCVKNRCLKTLRKFKIAEDHNLEALSTNFTQEDEFVQKELAVMVSRLLNKIPGKSKEIFELSREEDLSYKQIAFRMNLTTKSVEYHISKVLTTLRKVIYFLPFFFA